jgi:hypothetical protein
VPVIPAKAGIQKIVAKYDLPELFEDLSIDNHQSTINNPKKGGYIN